MLLELLERRRAAGRQYSRVLYVGDGRGDFCPAVLLLHGGGTAAGGGDAAAADGGGGGSQSPCGGSGNRVYARQEYPDGLPCSLSVMLRNEAHGDGGSPASASVAAVAGRQAGAEAEARVVPWRRPQELAQLLRRELHLAA